MTRTALLATSAAAAFWTLAGPAAAAPCAMPAAGAIVCTAPASDPVTSDADGASVTVGADASVESDDASATPVALSGDGAALLNDGLVAQSDEDGYAVTGAGNGLDVINRGTIRSGDRGIEMLSGADLRVVNEAGALIEARRQAIRSKEDVPGAYVENAGTVTSSEGRAVQLRSFGATLVNTGDLYGAEEVVEARGDFRLVNSGLIRLVDESVEDEDGVQLASGEVVNSGTIRGTDDGIDIDEGRIVNEAGGQIVSLAPDANSNSGIDVDEVYDDEGINPIRPSGPLTIVNAGLIEGPSAIGTAETSTSEITIENSGTLLGRGGTAIRFAEGQGDSVLSLSGDSEIVGDVLFGAGDDIVRVAADVRGPLASGLFDGGDGTNLANFGAFDLADIASFEHDGGDVTLSLFGAGDPFGATFRDFDRWTFGDTTYATAALAETVGVAPIPLPAGLPLLAGALGGLAILRRRRC